MHTQMNLIVCLNEMKLKFNDSAKKATHFYLKHEKAMMERWKNRIEIFLNCYYYMHVKIASALI